MAETVYEIRKYPGDTGPHTGPECDFSYLPPGLYLKRTGPGQMVKIRMPKATREAYYFSGNPTEEAVFRFRHGVPPRREDG